MMSKFKEIPQYGHYLWTITYHFFVLHSILLSPFLSFQIFCCTALFVFLTPLSINFSPFFISFSHSWNHHTFDHSTFCTFQFSQYEAIMMIHQVLFYKIHKGSFLNSLFLQILEVNSQMYSNMTELGWCNIYIFHSRMFLFTKFLNEVKKMMKCHSRSRVFWLSPWTQSMD